MNKYFNILLVLLLLSGNETFGASGVTALTTQSCERGEEIGHGMYKYCDGQIIGTADAKIIYGDGVYAIDEASTGTIGEAGFIPKSKNGCITADALEGTGMILHAEVCSNNEKVDPDTCECVECYKDSHCGENATCDLATKTCKKVCITNCSGQEVGTECCDSAGNKGMCNGSSCKTCGSGEVYKYTYLQSNDEIKCCSAPNRVVSGYNDVEGMVVYNCCEEGYFIPEKDNKVILGGDLGNNMVYCLEKGKMLFQGPTGGYGNVCVRESSFTPGFYTAADPLDVSDWSLDDYKSYFGYYYSYEDCSIDYSCSSGGFCLIKDIPAVSSCSGQADKMPCKSGSQSGICIQNECCTTPNDAKTQCCSNGQAKDGTCCPALTTQGCDTETDSTTGCLKCKQSAADIATLCANGGGTIVTASSGTFCRSKESMFGNETEAWCQNNGMRMPTLKEMCPSWDGTEMGSCPELNKKGSGGVWSGTSYGSDGAYYVSLSDGKLHIDSYYGGNATAFCY